DAEHRQARVLFGGAGGEGDVRFVQVDPALFGATVRALVLQIPWTGQLGDSREPLVLADVTLPVTDGGVSVEFGGSLPRLVESSAYQIILTPGPGVAAGQPPSLLWRAGHEA